MKPPLHQRGRRGFTMIEMMVAITLLSVLTLGFFMALRVGLSALEKTSTRMDENRRVVGVERVLMRQFAGLIPAMGSCGGSRPVPIFEGGPTTMRFVSSESLADAGRGYPQLLEYMIVPGELPGSRRVVVNERPYAGPGSLAQICAGATPFNLILRPPVANASSFILADRLSGARFTYLYEDMVRNIREWREGWQPGAPSSTVPAAVRIEMASLATEPVHMRMAPVTLRIRVNRMYGDAYPYLDVEPPPRLP